MDITATLLILLSVLLFVIYWLYLRGVAGGQEQQSNALALIRNNILFCRFLAAHRGAMNAYLSGDESFLQTAEEMRSNIRKQFSAHEVSCAALSTIIKPDWAKTVQLTCDTLFGFTKPDQRLNSFSQHTQLIRQLLDQTQYVGTICEHSDNPELRKSFQQMLSNELPRLGELLGQARGQASGMAANEKLLGPDLVKLSFMAKRAAIVKNNLPSESADASVSDFISLLDSKLSDSNGELAKPKQIFKLGSDAIAEIAALIDRVYSEVELTVNTNLAAQEKKKKWVGHLIFLWVGTCIFYVTKTLTF